MRLIDAARSYGAVVSVQEALSAGNPKWNRNELHLIGGKFLPPKTGQRDGSTHLNDALNRLRQTGFSFATWLVACVRKRCLQVNTEGWCFLNEDASSLPSLLLISD